MKATKRNIEKAKVAPELITKATELGKASFHRGVYALFYDSEFMQMMWSEFGTVVEVNTLERLKLMNAWQSAQMIERLA